ncbi:MAG: proline dehydrogenase family protein [Chloroflexota bacterium]
MLRSFFVYLSKAGWARRAVTRWPLMRPVVARFIAGDTLAQALQAVQALNQNGIQATLDHLGENTTTIDEARQAVAGIASALEGIAQRGLRANVSIKLTQIGLRIDAGLCADLLAEVLEQARRYGSFIRVDMEDSPLTQVTLDMVRQMRPRGFENVGVVIQSYLYRSPEDIRTLIAEGIRVRLCKGAYQEAASVAYPQKRDVDAQYDRLARLLLDGALTFPALSADGKIPPLPALATHDVRRIEQAKAYAVQIGLPKAHLEFQMLYGIRRDLQESLAAQGYPVRVYVPYGTQWYPYFMRRLAERPANVWFIASNFFRK